MSSDQMLTKSSSNNNNTTTTTSTTSNLPNAEPLNQLKQDNSRVVLTADKGVAMVIMAKRTTETKPKPYYKTPAPIKYFQRIPPANLKTNSFPFSRISNKQEASALTSINSYTSPVHSPPKFYGLPKIHKVGTPLRPIVFSRGSITYGVAKELAYIIKPLVGQSPHHLKNTQQFIQQLQGKKLEPGEVITSLM